MALIFAIAVSNARRASAGMSAGVPTFSSLAARPLASLTVSLSDIEPCWEFACWIMSMNVWQKSWTEALVGGPPASLDPEEVAPLDGWSVALDDESFPQPASSPAINSAVTSRAMRFMGGSSVDRCKRRQACLMAPTRPAGGGAPGT